MKDDLILLMWEINKHSFIIKRYSKILEKRLRELDSRSYQAIVNSNRILENGKVSSRQSCSASKERRDSFSKESGEKSY